MKKLVFLCFIFYCSCNAVSAQSSSEEVGNKTFIIRTKLKSSIENNQQKQIKNDDRSINYVEPVEYVATYRVIMLSNTHKFCFSNKKIYIKKDSIDEKVNN